MLSSLKIQNYAIIRDIDIRFDKGFTTLTGETGAGKSILLGALSLILGQRADANVLQDKSRKCIVEGEFSSVSKMVKDFMEARDLDVEKDLIIRREITVNGKSRAFVNDSPVNLPVLKELGSFLVDIHSQHENLELSQQKYQTDVVDAFGGLLDKRNSFKSEFLKFKELTKELHVLENERKNSLARLDYVKFQFEELEKANLREGEYAEAEAELELLQHAEEIKSNLFSAWKQIDGDETNAQLMLKDALSGLHKISGFYKPANDLAERLNSLLIELKDISMEAEILAEKSEHDPGRINELEDRLNLLNHLFQKHNIKDEADLIAIRDGFSEEILSLDKMEFKLDDLQKKIFTLKEELNQMAGDLSLARNTFAKKFTSRIIELMVQLGIPNAKFNVEIKTSAELNEYGADEVQFMFSANKSSQVRELSKVASGGELSRLMLSIKSIISHSLGMPTIIFDEIDTGVSGEIAHKIGSLMKEMSEDRQVLSVTHLPQVAASGDQHYFIYKEENTTITETLLKNLTKDERVVEIAKMLSGEATSDAAMQNARVLLGSGKK